MANADVIAFNIATFISTLFLLEYGADIFIDHTAIVSTRIGVSSAIIALLTAGAEWEELGVVIASLSHSRSSLAIGNIVGSAISNIIGAFSLGLITQSNSISFDKSSRVYSLLLLLLTTFVTPIIYFARKDVWMACGGILLGTFVIYVVSIVWAIGQGKITAPELSDDEDSASDDGSDASEDVSSPLEADDAASDAASDASLLPSSLTASRRPAHTLMFHIGYLVLGILSISLSAYIISHAATNITDQLGVSDVLFGVIVLAIATTLPEKFVAVLSGSRGRVGILVANTVGSNIFLLSLCMGIIMLDTKGHMDAENVNMAELAVMWASTLAFTGTVWFGGRWSRWIGAIMLVGYIAFLVLEFTVIRKL